MEKTGRSIRWIALWTEILVTITDSCLDHADHNQANLIPHRAFVVPVLFFGREEADHRIAILPELNGVDSLERLMKVIDGQVSAYLELLFLDCGSKDEYQLHLGMRLMCRRLDGAGIDYVSEEFPDDHRSVSYRYDRSVPMLAGSLAEA